MKKILIVEDDPAIAALLFDFLTEAGYKAVTAADGVEALTLFSAQAFDLILLDVMLPRIDGFGVCEVIRQKSKVPIIMLPPTPLPGASSMSGSGRKPDMECSPWKTLESISRMRIFPGCLRPFTGWIPPGTA